MTIKQNISQSDPSDDALRGIVREAYGKVVRDETGCGEPACGGGDRTSRSVAQTIGYDLSDLESVPEEANLGLGCGNPAALAELSPGEVVLDLGAGAGLDALIAAQKVGPEGRVIGVDMTPEMLERARSNAVKVGVAGTVEFREGIIEDLPVVSESVDVVISNCVINLSPDKPKVFREAFRVLKPGGRLAVSDIVLSEPLPQDIRDLATVYVACIGGALVADEYLGAMRDAGFTDIEWTRTPAAELLSGGVSADQMAMDAISELGPERILAVAQTLFSYKIRARRP
jgi:SAM-dependent methyltransferase